jgi:lipopolysaccharide/colanic/teichoic acid biosynthesis glycosyltransferase
MRADLSTGVQRGAKRASDLVAAAVLLVVLLPVLLMVAVVVRVTSRGPIIFRQRRIGKDGCPFVIYKFRTMTMGADRSQLGTYVSRDDPRITQVGRTLRRISVDELPQLVNILRGDMSFVGPRPDLPHHVERYTQWQRRRLEVRPGITGWAQVSGRNDLGWDERIRLDVEYIDTWSLLLDLAVLARTVGVVLGGGGAALPPRVGDPR